MSNTAEEMQCPTCGAKGHMNDPNIPRPAQHAVFHKYGVNKNGRQKYKCRQCGRIFTGTKRGRPKKNDS